MNRFALLCSAILACVPGASGQNGAEKSREEDIRREKIEAILRAQDLRIPYDRELRGALSDNDAAVRERAFLAYASLQDTGVVALLSAGLVDVSPPVQEAAAFAIGQTATLLSEYQRRTLEDELIWRRLPQTGAKARLIEELGRFGTAEALRLLIIRAGNAFPDENQEALQLAIARFAIRGIVSDDGVRYLAKFLSPAGQVPWQAMYALQRIGDHPVLRGDLGQLVLAREHADPLVRMFLASLLGRLKDSPTVLKPLQRMADADPDWRVRVNAISSLGSLGVDGRPASMNTIRRAFSDSHPYVALTAIRVIGNSDFQPSDTAQIAKQTLGELRRIAENRSGNFLWQMQGEAVSALARLLGQRAFPLCVPTPMMQPHLQAELLRAAGRTGSPEALPLLSTEATDSDARVACGALDGLLALLQTGGSDTATVSGTRQLALKALTSPDVAVVTTAAGLLGEKHLLSSASVEGLLQRLSTLRVPDDIEAYQEICATLARIKDHTAVPALIDLLKIPDPAVALAAANALDSLTGVDHRARIPHTAEPLHTDLDFPFLRTLPERITVTLETSRGDIQLELNKAAAPFTVMTIAKLAIQRGFYRGRTFHRVVPNFVIQGGDPRGDGWGGPGFVIRSEFSPLRYETGTVGIASAGKDTEGSQFFITHSPQPQLDGRYTIIGTVIKGQEVVDRILVDDRIFDMKVHLGR